jgi:hypothetical protein
MSIEVPATDTVAVSSAPETGAGASVSSVEVPAVADASTASTPEETKPDFDWSSWDGTQESLPDDARSWHEKFSAHYAPKITTLEEQVREAAAQKSYYDALVQGLEDPRVTELTQKLTQAQASLDEMKRTHEITASEHKKLTDQIQAAKKQEVEAQITTFFEKHKETLADATKYALFDELTDDEKSSAYFEFDDAIRLVNASPAVLAEAKNLRAQGVPSSRAVEIAEKYIAAVEPQARRGATIVAGAGGKRSPTTAVATEKAEPSLDDMRLNAVSRHLGR